MKKHPIKTFNTIATQHRPLANLQNKASYLQTIEQYLLQALPSHLQHQCYLANINGHTLTVYAKNASSLTQLRFYSPNTLTILQEKYPNIKTINCQINPSFETATQSKPHKPPHVSTQTCYTISQMAQSIDAPELSDALQRLAKTLQDQS